MSDDKKCTNECKDGEYHGQGTLTRADGTIDSGIWKKDKLVKRNKIKSLVDKKEEKLVKKRDTKLAKKKPTQTQSSPSGCKGSPLKEKKIDIKLRKTVIEWKDCHGALTYKDGSKYVGWFKNGKFSGRGTFTYNDGRVKLGFLKENKSIKFANLIRPQWPSKTDFECLNICKNAVKGMTIVELNSFCMM